MKGTGHDLRYSAELAVNNYTRFLDGQKGYIPYFYLFTGEETFGAHCEWDFGDATGRYLDALILCERLTGGTPETREAVSRLYAALTAMLSPEDGLCYRPAGYEWVKNEADSFDQRSCLLGLASYYRRNPDMETKRLGERLIQGLYTMGVEYGDYFYIPVSDYHKGLDREWFRPRPYDACNYQADPCHYGGGVIIYPLMYWHRVTGSQAALELAGKISRFIVSHSKVFAEDGSFYVRGLGVDSDGHFHSRVDTAAGILEYALATGDKGMAEFSRRAYHWAASQGTPYGLFPEGLGKAIEKGLPEEYPEVSRHSETCGTADMIELALLFGERVSPNYYDDAERYLNHLIASQLDDLSWIAPCAGKEDTELFTYRDAAERYRGSYTGRTTPNDLTNFGRYDNMGCCSAAGGRGVALLWEKAAEEVNGTLYVNMLLNCGNQAASIRQLDWGKFQVRAKGTPAQLKIRVPGWLREGLGQVRFLWEDGATAEALLGEGWFLVSNRPGHTLRMDCPTEETVAEQAYCGVPYRVAWRQNIVVEVTPKGEHMLLYTR